MWESTGNAWAAAGMLRVLGTIQSSSFSRNFKVQISDLGDWVAEIHSAMYPHLVRLPAYNDVTCPHAYARPHAHSNPTVYSRTTQTTIALTVSTTRRAARCSLRPFTASRFSPATRSLFGKRGARLRCSLRRTVRLPIRRASPWPRPGRYRHPLRAGPRQGLSPRRRVHSRTPHTLLSTAGSNPSSIPLTLVSKARRAPRAKPSR